MKWTTTWKHKVKSEIVSHDSVQAGSEYSVTWEKVYQAFKERLEKEKVLESKCEHISLDGASYKDEYKYKYCPQCGEEL